MRVLGIETSCDETGAAVYDSAAGLLAHALHSQVALHAPFGGVVPELASRDHVRHLVPLIREVLSRSGTALGDVDAIAYTEGPGLAGALLVGASLAHGLAYAIGKPAIGIHHLEGHLLSPLLATPRPAFPFVALLVTGGHTQLFEVRAVGDYRLLGDTLDDAAGEAFDKTAKLLGLPYPGGPALAELAGQGREGAVTFPRPMIDSGDLAMSFSGLKTAVLTEVRRRTAQADGRSGEASRAPGSLDERARADIAHAFQEAVVEVLVAKALAALERTGMKRLVVAGGVGANRLLRERLKREVEKRGAKVFYPDLVFCTDNGAMIALAGAMRMGVAPAAATPALSFGARPRWPLAEAVSVSQ